MRSAVTRWFPTLIYQERLQSRGAAAFNRELLTDCEKIRAHDSGGRNWSRKNYPGGYTSYGSLDRLHRVASGFDGLRERLDAHVQRYTRTLGWDLRGGKLAMTDCWVNFMPDGCAHSFHLHPQAVVSGTYYVCTPPGSAGLKFEDPRLSRLMAAPPRRSAMHVLFPARAGELILFESWLRHEVPMNRSRSERVSISFNYHWL